MAQISIGDFFGETQPQDSLEQRLESLDALGTVTPDTTISIDDFFEQPTQQVGEMPKVQSSDVWDWLPDVFKKGYNESLTGMAQRIATGEAPFDIEDYHPSVLKDITANVISFLVPTDLLAFGLTGGAGALAAKKAGQIALKQMARAGVKKKFAEKTLKEGMETLVAKAGVSAGTGATALGTYSGIADAMVQQIEEGNVDWGKVVGAGAKGATLGATVGAIGGRAAFKGTSEAGRIAQEIAAFGIGSPALELRLPTPQDFVHAGGMILGIRGATGAAKAGWRAATGQPIIQPQVKAKKASPEKIEEVAKARLEKREDIRSKDQIWKSERKGFQETKIVGERTSDKTGLKLFQLKDSKSGKTLELPRNEFFKEFDLYRDALSPEALQKKRLGEVAGLSKKLTSEEYGFSDKFIKEKKFQIAGNENISSKDMSPRQLFKYRKSLRYEKELIDIKKDLKGLLEFEPGKTLLERILPEKWVQPMMSAEARIKTTEGRQLGHDMIPKADARRAELVGSFVQEAVAESGLKKYKNPKEIADALEGRPSSAQAKAVADKVKVALDRAYEMAKDAGIDVSGYIEKYYPRMMRKDIQQIIFDDLMPFLEKNHKLLDSKITRPQDLRIINKLIESSVKAGEFNNYTNRALNKLVKEGKLSYKDAMDNLRSDVMGEMYSPFGNLEKARKLELPAEFYERNAKEVIVRYFDKFARRVASAEVFGKKGENAKALLDSLRFKNPGEYKVLKELYSNFTGLSSVDPAKAMSPAARKLAERIMSFEYATKIGLGFATIPNITQFTISTAAEAGYWRFLRGAYQLLDKNTRNKIKRSGATHHNVMDMLLGTDIGWNPMSWRENIKKITTDKGNRFTHVASLLSTVSLFKPINYLNQLLAASTADVYVRDLHRISKKSVSGARRDWAKRNLKRLGISDKDYNKASLSDKNIEHAMYRFAKESQLQKDILKDPLAFNNPKLRPFFIFKRFGFRQAKYMKDLMRREVFQQKNVLVPLRLAVGGWFGADFVIWAKDNLIKLLSGEDVVREDRKGFEKLIESISTVGAMGFFSDILDAEDKLAAIKFTLNPVVLSDMEKLYTGTRSLFDNVEEYGFNSVGLQRSVKGYAGIFGSVIKQLAKRAEMPGQEKRGISNEKGKLRSKIFDYFLEGKKDKAKQLILDWNRKRGTNPFTMNDISSSDIYQYVVRKLMYRLTP
tara:strand:- start:2483 stop:6064 length:3582 start_codon:yes stop_codon:yes gene_type:complete